jgi:branched-chain amino acid transport system substrate-binding protein
MNREEERMRKRSRFWVAGILALTIAAAATLASGAGARATKFDCKGGAITIGIAKAKTGGFAFFDSAGAKASIVTLEQLNAKGGIDGCKFKTTWQDTKSDPALAQQVANDLIKQGNQIIITPADFDIGVGASLAAKKAKLFSLSPEASSVDWPKAAKPYHFIQAVTISDLGYGQAVLANQRGWKTAYVVSNDAFNFFTAMEKAFRAKFKGKIVGRDVVQDDQTDYSANVSKIRDLKPQPDFIYLNDYFPHVGTFIKQLRDAGINTQILGNSTFSSVAFPKVVGLRRMSKVVYVSQNYYEGPTATAATRAFNAAYKKRWKTFPENLNTTAAYEGMILLADALKKAGSTDAAAVAKAMSAEKNFKLPTGAVVYSWTNGYTHRSVTVVGFTATGAFKQVALLDPRKA